MPDKEASPSWGCRQGPGAAMCSHSPRKGRGGSGSRCHHEPGSGKGPFATPSSQQGQKRRQGEHPNSMHARRGLGAGMWLRFLASRPGLPTPRRAGMPGGSSPSPGTRECVAQEGRLLTASWKGQGGLRGRRRHPSGPWWRWEVSSLSQRTAVPIWVPSFQAECRLVKQGPCLLCSQPNP